MKKLNVLVLMDLMESNPEQNFEEDLKRPDWKTEQGIIKALKTLGHKVQLVGLFDDITPLTDAVKNNRPDIVFNSAESCNNNTSL